MGIEPPLPDQIVVDQDITLRPMFTVDPEVMHARIHENLDHLGRFLVWARADYDLDGVMAFAEEKRTRWNDPQHEQGFGIFFQGEFAGAVGIKGFASLTAAVEIGYWLSEHLQGRGMMTRSVSALIKLAFETYDMNQIIIKAAPGNSRSRAIPERLGFTETGLLRQMSKNAHGELLDLVNYSLLRSEWQP